MPSEPRIQQALEALAAPRATFRAAVAAAVDQTAALLDAHRVPADGRAARTATELGVFAAGRLDPARFAAVLGEGDAVDALALARIERAYETLQQIAARGDDGYVVRVASGGSPAAAVGRALAEIGRVFRAAREVELARSGRADAARLEGDTAGFAFREWNRAERQIAPPLVVELDGADLQAGGLAEFMDGRMKLVLVTRGIAPAAALVRLVTPGVFVEQTREPERLARLASVDAPAVAALVPEGAALFVHEPGDGPSWERIEVLQLPTGEPRTAVGGSSAFQQRQELEQLRSLATRPATAATATATTEPVTSKPAAVGPVTTAASATAPPAAIAAEASPPESPRPTADPADRLAAWLLSQTDLGRG